MTMVGRTPFSTSMRETSKALSPPPITATCRPEVGARLAHVRRAEMHAPRGRQAAGIGDLVEPLLAAESRSGGDHHGNA